jgi:hypothetical protein
MIKLKKLFSESLDERKKFKKKREYVPTINYDDETAGYETGEYSENEPTLYTMPGLAVDDADLIDKIKNAPEVKIPHDNLMTMRNTDYGEVMKMRPRKRQAKAKMLAKQYGKNWKGISKDIRSGTPRQAPIAVQDIDGDLYLLAGNTRLMATAGMNKKTPLKVIPYNKKFKKQKDVDKHMRQFESVKLGDIVKDILSEGKFKFKGKYLYMPGGEVSSIPKRNERERIIFQIKNEKFKLYDNGFNEFHLIGDRNDYYLKGTKDLLRFLNKYKAKYIGIGKR